MLKLNTTEYKDLTQLVRDLKQRGILDAFGDGVSIQDTDLKVVYQNRVHRNIVGEHVGKYCYAAYGSSEQACENCPLVESFRQGGVQSAERSAYVNEKALYLEITVSPIKDEDGDVIAGIEVVRDITEQRKSEETLRESENKYCRLVEISPDMIFITERETGRIMDVNESVCKLLGHSRDDLIGTLSCDHLVSSQRDSYTRKFDNQIKTGRYFVEFDFKKADGSIITVEVRGAAFDDYVLMIGRDITQRHIYEEEIKNRVQELESFYEMAIGREVKMMELKKKVEKLKKELAGYKKK